MKSFKACASALALAAAFVALIATCASAAPVTLLSENFDAATPPALPAGWSMALVGSGIARAWVTDTVTHRPSGYSPVSAPNLACLNASSIPFPSVRLYCTTGLDTTPYDRLKISFQMFHDPSYNDPVDAVQVQVSTDGSTWQNAGDPIAMIAETAGWQQHEVNLSAYAGMASVRVGLLGTCYIFHDCYVDDILVTAGAAEACTPAEGRWWDTFTITGGTGFGEGEGSVFLDGSQTQVLSWTNDAISCRIDQPRNPGLTDVEVAPVASPTMPMTDAFTVLSSCTPATGTTGTSFHIDGIGFGNAKGKVSLKLGGENPIPLKVTAWSPTQITCEVSKWPSPETFNLIIQPKSSPAIVLPQSFETRMISLDAPAPSHGPAGTVVTLTARYLGTKKGKVSLFLDGIPKPLVKACKVNSWVMDAATGAGTIQVTIPKGLAAATYDLVVVGPDGGPTALPAAFTYETP